MKHCLTFLLMTGLVVISQPVHGQGSFYLQVPAMRHDNNANVYHSGCHYNQIDFISDSIGWVLGSGLDKDLLLKTTDAGKTWEYQSALRNDQDEFYIYDCSASFAYIGSYRSSDGGKSWEKITYPHKTPGYTNHIQFVNDLTGWYASYGMIGNGDTAVYKTTNRGLTWKSQSVLYGDGPIFFISENVGWVCGTGGTIYKTTNSGIQWSPISSVAGTISCLDFVDSLNGWLVVDIGGNVVGSTLYRTTNGGLTWDNLNVASSVRLAKIKFSDKQRGWSLSGILNKTTDGGLTWVSVNNLPSMFGRPFSAQNFSITKSKVIYITANAIESSGNNTDNWHYMSVVCRSTNDGDTWEIPYDTTDIGLIRHLTDISFANINDGFATGGKRILKTSNNGKQWVLVDTLFLNSFFDTVETNFNAVSCVSSGSAWVAGDYGRILKYDNTSKSLIPQTIGFENDVKKVVFVDDSLGWVLTAGIEAGIDGDELLSTTNGGDTWIKKEIGKNLGLSDITFLDKNNGWVVGADDNNNGIVFRTSNGGYDWSVKTFSNSSRFVSVSFISPRLGWICNGDERPSIYKTTDGGLTLSDPYSPVVETVKNNSITIRLLSPQHAFLRTNRFVYETEDSGMTWKKIMDVQGFVSNNCTSNILFFPSGEGWIIGDSRGSIDSTEGFIFKYEPKQSPTVSIQSNTSLLDFKTIPCGAAKDTFVTVINTGELTVMLDSATVSGNGFSLVAPVGKVKLWVGDSIAYSIRFYPGGSSDSVGLFSVSGPSVSANVKLHGNCEVVDTAVYSTPPILDFKVIQCGNTKDSVIIVKNIGHASVTLDAAKVAGGGFSLVSPTGKITLTNVGDSIQYTIRFSPIGHGDSTGLFTVVGTGGVSASVILRGSCPKHDTVSDVSELGRVHDNFWLGQNYPNPFSSSTIIPFSFAGSSDPESWRLEVHDMLGRIVYRTIVDNSTNKAQFDAHDVPQGMYLYSLTDGVKMYSRRMAVVK